MLYTTRTELADVRHVEGVLFHCADCGQDKPVGTSGGTGYGYYDDRPESPICYDCCGKRELAAMIETGRAVLYLTCEPASKMKTGRNTTGKVSNWPGTLSYRCYTTVGHHNIARVRYDLWFNGPDGYKWHGVQYVDNTQIARCKRTKERC